MAIDSHTAWQIRRAESSDANAVTACMDAAYRPYIERMGGALLPPMMVDYAQEIENTEVWVADLTDNLLGVMVFVESAQALQIANIAVHPTSQGQGVGKGLINFAVDVARARGHKAIDLATHPLLEENVSLYAYLGWVEVSRDETHVLMTREIV